MALLPWQTMNLSRRHILGWGTLLGGRAAMLGGGAALLGGGAAFGFQHFTVPRTEQPRAALRRDPRGLLHLPAGYDYRILAETNTLMSDGASRRGLPDGMACAADDRGRWILMVNHELDENGGVSRLVLDPKSLTVISSNDVLTGTIRNCGGGPSPWGWLSCEEVPEGGVYQCPWGATEVLSGPNRIRIDDYGTFKHEAVCIDPTTCVAYLTEDDGPSHLYRMMPDDPARPFVGQLQALSGRGPGIKDTATMRPGDRFECEWVNVQPSRARASARQKRAAIFHRGEGIWFSDGIVYMAATAENQLFKLSFDGSVGVVELITNDLESPDNITVAPNGEVIIAEDQSGVCRLRVVTPGGEVSTFAENAQGPGQEFAGVCFSPDGSTLFCNLQKSGQTVAITGPFSS